MASTTEIQDIIDGVYEKYKDVDDGAVATYIPELAKADPNDFGICLATVDGQVFTAGGWAKKITIPTLCKPLPFQMALEKNRRGANLQHRCVRPHRDGVYSIELHT